MKLKSKSDSLNTFSVLFRGSPLLINILILAVIAVSMLLANVSELA